MQSSLFNDLMIVSRLAVPKQEPQAPPPPVYVIPAPPATSRRAGALFRQRKSVPIAQQNGQKADSPNETPRKKEQQQQAPRPTQQQNQLQQPRRSALHRSPRKHQQSKQLKDSQMESKDDESNTSATSAAATAAEQQLSGGTLPQKAKNAQSSSQTAATSRQNVLDLNGWNDDDHELSLGTQQPQHLSPLSERSQPHGSGRRRRTQDDKPSFKLPQLVPSSGGGSALQKESSRSSLLSLAQQQTAAAPSSVPSLPARPLMQRAKSEGQLVTPRLVLNTEIKADGSKPSSLLPQQSQSAGASVPVSHDASRVSTSHANAPQNVTPLRATFQRQVVQRGSPISAPASSSFQEQAPAQTADEGQQQAAQPAGPMFPSILKNKAQKPMNLSIDVGLVQQIAQYGQQPKVAPTPRQLQERRQSLLEIAAKVIWSSSDEDQYAGKLLNAIKRRESVVNDGLFFFPFETQGVKRQETFDIQSANRHIAMIQQWQDQQSPHSNSLQNHFSTTSAVGFGRPRRNSDPVTPSPKHDLHQQLAQFKFGHQNDKPDPVHLDESYTEEDFLQDISSLPEFEKDKQGVIKWLDGKLQQIKKTVRIIDPKTAQVRTVS